ncbi:MAG: pyridine nucleotide-disulfide oxidoreductase [Chlamydiae bacterium RIFCSPHIGHO2_12_FULL_49_11]|nr:MAG: pyridine nucleotide-disulfide oxidoreductase [Chlamydiae bacterium RIFCSPHIGHO2_12_FULL_49_11]
MNKKRLVVIGGGFSGLNLVRTLKKAPMDIVLIDKKNHHLFQPLLYQAATATLSPRDISIALREVFAKQKNTTVIMGEVTQIDKKKKKVLLGNGDRFTYDYLAVGIGAKHSYFGHDEWEPFAPGIKTITDALKIREHILMSFEKAERLDSIHETHKYLTFVIVGAGPTGVEFAGTISELIQKTMHRNFRSIRTEKARVILIEAADRVLPTFHPKLAERTAADLEKLGVTVLTRTFVTNINAEGVEIGDQFIEAKNVIWAAGNTVSPLLLQLETECDKSGRAVVRSDLSIPNHPEIFVLGDAAHYKTPQRIILPAVATVALQEGRFVGKLLRDEVERKKPSPLRTRGFVFRDKGSLATIGAYKAVGSIKGVRFTGLLAWLIWGFVHIGYLIGFRHRLTVMIEWFIHHMTGIRSSRIIHGTIDEDLPKSQSQ